MKSRLLFATFWTDGFIGELTPVEKLLYLNYHYSESVNLLFCFVHPDRKAMFETGATKDELIAFKTKAQQSGKILFNGEYVYLVNASRYEGLKGEKIEKGRESALARLPVNIQEWYTSIVPKRDTPIDTPIIGVSDEPEIVEKSEPKKEPEYKSKTFLTHMTEDTLAYYQELTSYPPDFIKKEATRCLDHFKGAGKPIKDYKATFRNWITSDIAQNAFIRQGKANIQRNEPIFTDLSHLGATR